MKSINFKTALMVLLLITAPFSLDLAAATDEKSWITEKAEQIKTKLEQEKTSSLSLTPAVFHTLIAQMKEEDDESEVPKTNSIGFGADLSYEWKGFSNILLVTKVSFNYNTLLAKKAADSEGSAAEAVTEGAADEDAAAQPVDLFAGLEVKPLYAYSHRAPKVGAYLKVGLFREHVRLGEEDGLNKVLYDAGLSASWDSFRFPVFQPETFDCVIYGTQTSFSFLNVSCQKVGAKIIYLIPIIGVDLGFSGVHALAEETTDQAASEEATTAFAWNVNFGVGNEVLWQPLENLIVVANATAQGKIGKTMFRPVFDEFPARFSFCVDVSSDLHFGQNFSAKLAYGLDISSVGKKIYDKDEGNYISVTNKVSLNFVYSW